MEDRLIQRNRPLSGIAVALAIAIFVAPVFAATTSTSKRSNTPEPLANAQWIRNPVFAEPEAQAEQLGPIVYPALSGRTNSGGKGGSRLRNLHTYFRTEIDLPDDPFRAMLTITADDYCKAYIDGRFVYQGPALCYPFAQGISTIDVTDQLDSGRHCLAVHAYYHGLGPSCRPFVSGDNRSGVVMALDVQFPDGSRARYTTDDSWRLLTSKTFSHRHLLGYQTQFNEDMDLRCEPVGWRQVGFDDSHWSEPLIDRQDHRFVPQITPPLEHWRAEPERVIKKSDVHYFYDFGGEVVGHTRVHLRGPRGHVVTIRHGEELSGPTSVRYKMRCNAVYDDRITLSGGNDLAEFYDYRGFRYIEILDTPEPPIVWVDVRHYPFDAAASDFRSSDELLDRIWTMCKRGVQMGCQEIFVDNPTREKGQHFVDTYITALSQMLLTADGRLAEKAIRNFQHSQRFDRGILSVAPGSYRQSIAEDSLKWPSFLEYHYLMTGDRQLLTEMVDAGLSPLLEYFTRLEGNHGLLTGVNDHKWVLIDWPRNLRGGYDYEATKNGENTVVNAHYYHALHTAARLMRYLGRDDRPYERKAERVKEAINARLYDSANGRYLDGYGSDHASLHAGAIPLCFGVVPEQRVAGVIDMIHRRRLDCGLYAALPVLEACYDHGAGDLAYDLITSRDQHSWHEMLRHGASTPLEAWAPDQKWNTAFCQPVGTMPIYLIITRLMGLRPVEPGWKAVRITPSIPSSLRHASLRFPTPLGEISARFDPKTGYRVTLPPGMRVESADADNVVVRVVRHSEEKKP